MDLHILTITDGFADLLREQVEDYKGIIAGARGASQQKFILGTMGSYFYIDLYKFVGLVEKRSRDTDVKALSASLMKEIDTMVFAEEHAAPQGKLDEKQFGLTINFPPNMQAYNSKYESYVSCFVSETTWLQFLMTYYKAIYFSFFSFLPFLLYSLYG